jgi:hypothetical protein
VQILQGCAAGKGLLVLSGQEFSGFGCWQEFAGALLAGIPWADLLAVVCNMYGMPSKYNTQHTLASD